MQRPPRRRVRRRRPPAGSVGNVLISADFAVLWLKQSVTALCDALFTTTLMIWLGVSTNSPISVGLALGALGAGYVLVGPFAEAATERWSRRKTMFVTDVVRSISTLLLTLALLPLLTPKRALALICLLCFVIGLMSRFSLAAQRSSLNAVVPPREHARGISRIQGSVALMTIIGPILAAMLFLFPSLVIPPGTPLLALLVTGFLLLLSAGGAQAMDREFTAKVRAINLRRKSQDNQPFDGEGNLLGDDEELWSRSVLRSGIANWVKGIRTLLQQPGFSTIARVTALVAFAGGILNVLEVFYVSDTLSRPGAFLGLLLGADAAGILLGSILFRYLDGHLRPSTNFAYAVPALGMTTMALVTTNAFEEALFWAGAMGIANGVMLLAAQTALVETEEYDKLPRLFVGYDTLTAMLSLAGIILGGLAAHILKVNTILLVAGLLLTLGGVFGWLTLSGTLKSFPKNGFPKRRTSAAQPEAAEQPDMESYDEGMDSGEPAEENEPAYGDAGEEEEAPAFAPAPHPTRQFGRPWGGRQMNNQMDDQEAGGYAEYEQPYDDGGEQEDENAWEPEQPYEQEPAPRPSLRLRPKPWEQPNRSGRNNW